MFIGREYLFVDGYNIINAWQPLQVLAQENLEMAREELINRMIEYQVVRDINLIIVFDAYKVKGTNKKIEKHGQVEVVFTKENETADTYIERRITEIGQYRKVTVATSDGMLQQLVMSRGGLRMSARELYHLLQDLKNEIERKRQKLAENSINFRATLDADTIEQLKKLIKEEKG